MASNAIWNEIARINIEKQSQRGGKERSNGAYDIDAGIEKVLMELKSCFPARKHWSKIDMLLPKQALFLHYDIEPDEHNLLYTTEFRRFIEFLDKDGLWELILAAVASSLRCLHRCDEAFEILLQLESYAKVLISQQDIPMEMAAFFQGYVDSELAEIYLTKKEIEKAKEYARKAHEVLVSIEWVSKSEPERLIRLNEIQTLS